MRGRSYLWRQGVANAIEQCEHLAGEALQAHCVKLLDVLKTCKRPPDYKAGMRHALEYLVTPRP